MEHKHLLYLWEKAKVYHSKVRCWKLTAGLGRKADTKKAMEPVPTSSISFPLHRLSQHPLTCSYGTRCNSSRAPGSPVSCTTIPSTWKALLHLSYLGMSPLAQPLVHVASLCKLEKAPHAQDTSFPFVEKLLNYIDFLATFCQYFQEKSCLKCTKLQGLLHKQCPWWLNCTPDTFILGDSDDKISREAHNEKNSKLTNLIWDFPVWVPTLSQMLAPLWHLSCGFLCVWYDYHPHNKVEIFWEEKLFLIHL